MGGSPEGPGPHHYLLPQPLQCWDSRCEPSQPSVPVPLFTLSLCVDSVTPFQSPRVSVCLYGHLLLSLSLSLSPPPSLSGSFHVSFPASLCLLLPVSVFMPVSVAPQSLSSGPQMFSSEPSGAGGGVGGYFISSPVLAKLPSSLARNLILQGRGEVTSALPARGSPRYQITQCL